jgi:ABC-type sulfate/molybdate transport systems ATPase subunit
VGSTLRLDDLVFGDRWRVSASVRTGELVAVRADPAAGTALARTVAGLAAPVAGTVWLDDREITGNAPVDRHIGYVPAGGGLLPHLTVRENIEYGLRRRETVRDLTQSWMQTVITQLELAPTLHLRPHLLSEAQRLRVAVARTVACLPEVLVLDLPYGAAVPLRDLLARTASPVAPKLPALVCTADPDLLASADRVVEVHT